MSLGGYGLNPLYIYISNREKDWENTPPLTSSFYLFEHSFQELSDWGEIDHISHSPYTILVFIVPIK